MGQNGTPELRWSRSRDLHVIAQLGSILEESNTTIRGSGMQQDIEHSDIWQKVTTK